MGWRKDCHQRKWLPVISWLLLYLLVACQPNQHFGQPLTDADRQLLLIGDWYPEDSVTIERFSDEWQRMFFFYDMFHLTGYRFDENNVCENHLGFYEYIDPEKGLILSRLYKKVLNPPKFYVYDNVRENWFGNIIRSYGNRTSYRVSDDSLSIYDPGLKRWIKQRMEFCSADTLILSSQNDSIRDVYSCKTYRISKKPLTDQIIVYMRETAFSRSRFFSISRSGEYVCSEYRSGYFAGRFDPEVYNQVETWFKKATQEQTLPDIKYSEVGPVDPSIPLDQLDPSNPEDLVLIDKKGWEYGPRVTFVTANQLVTIGYESQRKPIINREFYQALFSTLFLPDHIRIQPCAFKDERVSDIWNDTQGRTAFERNDSTTMQLYGTERLYLLTLLEKAVPASRDFKPVYRLKVFGSSIYVKDIQPIETDGRYYRYMINGKLEILDIGFNFIEKYGLEKRLSSEKVVTRH